MIRRVDLFFRDCSRQKSHTHVGAAAFASDGRRLPILPQIPRPHPTSTTSLPIVPNSKQLRKRIIRLVNAAKEEVI